MTIGIRISVQALLAEVRLLSNFKWLAVSFLLALLLGGGTARAQIRDDEYLRIYNIIQQADTLNSSGDTNAAKAKYLEAQNALRNFQWSNPNWYTKVVTYRMNYVAQKIAALTPVASVPATKESKPVASTSGLQVKLLEAGAEPRKVLRLHVNPGNTQSVALTMKMAMNMASPDGSNITVAIPPVKLPLGLTIKNVADNGDITYEIVTGELTMGGDSETAAPMLEAMKAALASVKGQTATATVSSRGLTRSADTRLASGAGPEMRQLMDQMNVAEFTTPLPEEAVGPGAKWEVTGQAVTQGAKVNQTVTTELVSLDGDVAVVKETIVQSGANQSVGNPAMPGLKVSLTKMTVNGNAETTLDLGKVMPLKGTADIHSEVLMGASAGQPKQAMTMKMDINLGIEGR